MLYTDVLHIRTTPFTNCEIQEPSLGGFSMLKLIL